MRVPRLGRNFGLDGGTIVTSLPLLPQAHPADVIAVALTLHYEVLFDVLFGVLIVNRRVGALLTVTGLAGRERPWPLRLPRSLEPLGDASCAVDLVHICLLSAGS